MNDIEPVEEWYRCNCHEPHWLYLYADEECISVEFATYTKPDREDNLSLRGWWARLKAAFDILRYGKTTWDDVLLEPKRAREMAASLVRAAEVVEANCDRAGIRY